MPCSPYEESFLGADKNLRVAKRAFPQDVPAATLRKGKVHGRGKIPQKPKKCWFPHLFVQLKAKASLSSANHLPQGPRSWGFMTHPKSLPRTVYKVDKNVHLSGRNPPKTIKNPQNTPFGFHPATLDFPKKNVCSLQVPDCPQRHKATSSAPVLSVAARYSSEVRRNLRPEMTTGHRCQLNIVCFESSMVCLYV